MNTTYLIVDAIFLAPCALLYVLTLRRRPPGHGTVLTITILALLLLTVVFDSLMIAGGLFTYDPERISGIRIGLAPIEDLAYPVAAALLCTTLWSLRRPAPGPTHGPRAPRAAASGTPEEAHR